MAILQRRLVVDTNIARSASTSEYPLSKACREVLDALMNSGHKIVITYSQKEEWNNHKSPYSRLWLRQMLSRRQYHLLSPEPDTGFTDRLYALECGSNQRQEMLKDIYLLESAIATDRLVLSTDEAMYDYFTRFGSKIGLNQMIVWLNPKDYPCAHWLEKGAPSEGMRMIPLQRDE